MRLGARQQQVLLVGGRDHIACRRVVRRRPTVRWRMSAVPSFCAELLPTLVQCLGSSQRHDLVGVRRRRNQFAQLELPRDNRWQLRAQVGARREPIVLLLIPILMRCGVVLMLVQVRLRWLVVIGAMVVIVMMLMLVQVTRNQHHRWSYR